MNDEQGEAESRSAGAWVMCTAVASDGKSSDWEKRWDPDATPLSEADAEIRYQQILEILFLPGPDGT